MNQRMEEETVLAQEFGGRRWHRLWDQFSNPYRLDYIPNGHLNQNLNPHSTRTTLEMFGRKYFLVCNSS